jgi:hypothetical protein
MPSTIKTLIAAGLLIGLAGCANPVNGAKANGNASASAPTLPNRPTASSSAPTTESSSPNGPHNARGNIERALGQEFQYPADDPVLTMAIDSVTPDFACTSDYSKPPEKGHFIAIDVRVSTGPGINEKAPGFSVSSQEFSVIGADGITATGLGTLAAYTCIDSNQSGLPQTFGAGQNYVGKVVIDSPTTTGTLLFQPSFSNNAVEVPLG